MFFLYNFSQNFGFKFQNIFAIYDFSVRLLYKKLKSVSNCMVLIQFGLLNKEGYYIIWFILIDFIMQISFHIKIGIFI